MASNRPKRTPKANVRLGTTREEIEEQDETNKKKRKPHLKLRPSEIRRHPPPRSGEEVDESFGDDEQEDLGDDDEEVPVAVGNHGNMERMQEAIKAALTDGEG